MELQIEIDEFLTIKIFFLCNIQDYFAIKSQLTRVLIQERILVPVDKADESRWFKYVKGSIRGSVQAVIIHFIPTSRQPCSLRIVSGSRQTQTEE